MFPDDMLYKYRNVVMSVLHKLKCNIVYNVTFVMILGNCISYAVTLESVMQGHENWIYSIQWEPETLKGKVGFNH